MGQKETVAEIVAHVAAEMERLLYLRKNHQFIRP